MAEVVRSWVEIQPDRPAYIFLGDGETETERCTYSELDARASLIAAELRRLEAQGERALLIYPAGSDFVAALLGCFYAGTVAVPAVVDRSPRAHDRFVRIVRDVQSSFALTTEATFQAIRDDAAASPELKALRWIRTDVLQSAGTSESVLANLRGSDPALIQYTSGSTAEPKGVVLTHANLMATNEILRVREGTCGETRTVTWLPIFHDLGLIGQVMQTAYIGALCVLMPPKAFLERPQRWLEAVTRFHATPTAATNFGYELCARRTSDQDCERLDLSSLTVAVIGTEPVRHSTIQRFERRFAPCGFSPKAFMPGYGLAETTLCVSGGPPNSGAHALAVDAKALANHEVRLADPSDDAATILIAGGEVMPGHEFAIVDPNTCRRQPANFVGEIWVRGPNVGCGYWNNREETDRIFGARLADCGESPYLRTGDLGFLQGVHLYVTGRLKDLMIIRGTNHYPQDIEVTVQESHENLRPGCGAAISLAIHDSEELVVLQEVRDAHISSLEAIATAIRHAVAADHGIVPHEIVLLPPRAIIKTGSGKIARKPCRDAYVAGKLPTLYRWNRLHEMAASRAAYQQDRARETSSDDLRRIVEDCAIRALDLAPDDRPAFEEDLTELGLDSASATALFYGIEKALGVELSMDFVASARTVSLMVEYLRTRVDTTKSRST